MKLEFVDTASDPGKARAAMQRALDDKPIAIFGPIYSGSVSATLKLTADAEVPQVMGGEAGPLTAQGSKYIFRTSFGQNVSMPQEEDFFVRADGTVKCAYKRQSELHLVRPVVQ